jgi:hypothetical protein
MATRNADRRILGALVLSLLTGPVLAQDRTTVPGPGGFPTQGLRIVADERVVVPPFSLTVAQLQNMDLVDANGRVLGDVANVVADPAGRLIAVTVTMGSALGIGAKEYVLPLGYLRQDGSRLMTVLTPTQIEKLPVLND